MNGIKRIAVISFSMIYLFLALSYVHFLPNYNQLTNNGYYSGAKHLTINAHAGLDAAHHHVLMRKLFYATAENKRQLLPSLVLVGLVVATLFVTATIFASKAEAIHSSLAAYAILRRHTYLASRSLRL